MKQQENIERSKNRAFDLKQSAELAVIVLLLEKIHSVKSDVDVRKWTIAKMEKAIVTEKKAIKNLRENIATIEGITFSGKQKDAIKKVLGENSLKTLIANKIDTAPLNKLKRELRNVVEVQTKDKRILAALFTAIKKLRNFDKINFAVAKSLEKSCNGKEPPHKR